MVHVHGRDVGGRARSLLGVKPERRLLVPVDVGKHEAVTLVADAAGERLVAPFGFMLDRSGLAGFVNRVSGVASCRDVCQIEVGVEAAGHYHRPITASGMLPDSWRLIELNPAHVTEQRRVLGKRGVKTDQIDLTAMFDLLAAGRGREVTGSDPLCELGSWVTLRRRRVRTIIATKNQLLGQMDRAFPGAGRCVASSLLDAKVGRLVIAHFADPARLARLGVDRFRRFAANRGVMVNRDMAERFVQAARAALPLDGADVARRVLASELALLERLETDADHAEQRVGELLPRTPFAVLLSTPGWSTIRVGRYAGAIGDPNRWPGPRQVYRAAGLTPFVYQSAGTRFSRQDLPGRIRRAERSAARTRHGTVAVRPGKPHSNRSVTSTRQTVGDHRLCHGQPGQPHRVRHGQRPNTLRPATLEGPITPSQSAVDVSSSITEAGTDAAIAMADRHGYADH